MKKQIWIETNELNDYLKDGWTHIFRQDGTFLSRRSYGTMEIYYLLEKEEVKDTNLYIGEKNMEYNVGDVYHCKNEKLPNGRTLWPIDADVMILGKYKDTKGWRYAIAKPPVCDSNGNAAHLGIVEVQWVYL